ncbi:MAPEG family protein [Photobacterium galatheae]|uniref:Membrane protein n=1 Tax=Photobacterium galatheae TaxID=1654360 RepID=A0A066RS73_9GAMM|nr:MAPEG family protein [Photobacterium galatheae]KDM90233.1 membrane protein [Photobacterium galatheae]MCM0151504.1 MAPEG family protein [Photobacterium galatheae]
MATSFFASVLALWLCWLSIQVIKARRRHQIGYGDGEGKAKDLQLACSAQSNAVNYIPIALILLFLLEESGGADWLIVIAGLVFTAGRVIHGRGILADSLKGRVLGMQLTLWPIIALAVLNLLFLMFG